MILPEKDYKKKRTKGFIDVISDSENESKAKPYSKKESTCISQKIFQQHVQEQDIHRSHSMSAFHQHIQH